MTDRALSLLLTKAFRKAVAFTVTVHVVRCIRHLGQVDSKVTFELATQFGWHFAKDQLLVDKPGIAPGGGMVMPYRQLAAGGVRWVCQASAKIGAPSTAER